MASPRSAWGIDIGNRALKAVKLVRDGDSIRVDDFDFIEHETVLSQSGDNRDDLIRHALQTFAGRKNTKGSAVAVGVSGQTSFARFIKLPPVEPKQIPQIVKFEAIQQIPFPLDEVEWAYQLFQSPDSPDIECGIFAMRKELVNGWVNQFTSLDLNVQAVQTNPLAVYNAVQRDGRLADGTAMVIDVGAENTDLIIAGENSIWMRSIPIGGNSFTETIMKAFKLPHQKAEELKRDAASSKYYRQILQAMRPVFADLVAEIQRSIGFYGSVNRENKITKIIALGGTFRMPSLPKYLQQNLSLEVERPDNFAAALPEDSKTAAALTENVLSLHAAYGLALQAMGETKVDSSLLPTAIRKRKMWQEKNKWFATAAAMCVGGLLVAGASWVLNGAAISSGSEQAVQSDDIKTQAEGLASSWSEVQSGGTSERQTILNINSLLAYRELWPSIVTDINMSLPQPANELAQALVAGDRDGILKTPRGDRRIVKIDTLESRYYADLAPILDEKVDLRTFANQFASSGGGGGGMVGGWNPGGFGGGGGEAPAPSGKRGYLVFARLVSPNQQASSTLIDNEFFAKLRAVVPSQATPKRDYAFLKPEFILSRNLSDDKDLRERILADFNASNAASQLVNAPPVAGGGGFPGGAAGVDGVPFPGMGGQPMMPGAGVGAGPNDAAAFKDPVTGEDILTDRVIEVMFVILLDPPEFGTGETPPDAPDATDAP